jgi:hypothetical protein
MINALRKFSRPWIDLRNFSRLDRSEKGVVFYAESRSMARHLHPLVRQVSQAHGLNVSYVTSDASDVMYVSPLPGVRPVFVGNRNAAAVFFRTLDAHMVITTTPDLGYAAYQRSKYNVHYVYVHHSIVSSHMIYKARAFDKFDTIFCVGPHHVAEIERREAMVATPAKNLIAFGHPKLDDLIRQKYSRGLQMEPSAILIAPSWGPNGLLETMGADLVRNALKSGRKTILRPHPETTIRQPKLVPALVKAFAGEPNFVYAPDVSLDDSFYESAVMISDWSGAAFEFALGLEKPVIFVDCAKKVLNLNYKELGMEPVEVSYRSKFGTVISPADISDLSAILEELIIQKRGNDVGMVRDEIIFNVGNSAQVGCREIQALWEHQTR